MTADLAGMEGGEAGLPRCNVLFYCEMGAMLRTGGSGVVGVCCMWGSGLGYISIWGLNIFRGFWDLRLIYGTE